MGQRERPVGRSGRPNAVTTPWLRLRRSRQLENWEQGSDRRSKRPI